MTDKTNVYPIYGKDNKKKTAIQKQLLDRVKNRVSELAGVPLTDEIEGVIEKYFEQNLPVCQITKRVKHWLRHGDEEFG